MFFRADEKVYFVLAGELTVIVGGKETVLKQNDSCVIGSNESREEGQKEQEDQQAEEAAEKDGGGRHQTFQELSETVHELSRIPR